MRIGPNECCDSSLTEVHMHSKSEFDNRSEKIQSNSPTGRYRHYPLVLNKQYKNITQKHFHGPSTLMPIKLDALCWPHFCVSAIVGVEVAQCLPGDGNPELKLRSNVKAAWGRLCGRVSHHTWWRPCVVKNSVEIIVISSPSGLTSWEWPHTHTHIWIWSPRERLALFL